jgi:hypothetical protein
MKVAKFYMVGDFNISPFANMHFSLLPKAMAFAMLFLESES